MVPPTQPSTISPDKVISSTMFRKHLNELSVIQIAANDTITKERENILPYINPAHNEIEDDGVYNDPDFSLNGNKDFEENYDDSYMDLIERDIHLFDNYSNISLSHQR